MCIRLVSRHLFLLTVFAAFSHLTAANVVAVNAASLTPGSVAPGSIVSIFGVNLTSGEARATDASTPPQTLGGATVTVGGVPASLFFVSSFQINAVLSPLTPSGTQTLTVTSSTGTQNGAIIIDPNAAPGLFSTSGTGTGDGAIENAITFQHTAFSIVTLGNATQLSLYATGLNLSVAPTVTIGGTPVSVTFYGKAPCCVGLDQINVQLPASLAGAGRVPVTLQSGAQVSNVVDIVILPPSGQSEFPDDQDNQTRAREISMLAWIPGTSTALIADENDDVVRVLDITQKSVTRVISLPEGAQPEGIATNGVVALVAERNMGKVAVIDLSTFTVKAEVTVGSSPQAVALAGTNGFVVNEDSDTVSVINLNANPPVVTATIPVGRGPDALDASTGPIYVANEDDGTISVISPATFTVSQTMNLGSIRPAGIAVAGTFGYAFVINAADGSLKILNLTSGNVTAGPNGLSGVTAVVVNASANTAYFANQAGGSVSVVPFTSSGPGTVTTIKAGLGVRSLAVDTKDQLLLATNEGTGVVTLIDLATGKVVGSINAVRSQNDDQDNSDDHNKAGNMPTITSMTPTSATAGGTKFTLTITGTNLNGAKDVVFVAPSGKGGQGDQGDQGNSAVAHRDKAFTVSNIMVNSGGTQLTASVVIAAGADTGPRTVIVLTPNGESSTTAAAGNTFTVH
jgi:uncharacterized protein (TIGR03437 family)